MEKTFYEGKMISLTPATITFGRWSSLPFTTLGGGR